MQTLRQPGQLVIWGFLMLLLPCLPLPSAESQPAVTCPPTTAELLGDFEEFGQRDGRLCMGNTSLVIR
jgi:hypothetical protein